MATGSNHDSVCKHVLFRRCSVVKSTLMRCKYLWGVLALYAIMLHASTCSYRASTFFYYRQSLYPQMQRLNCTELGKTRSTGRTKPSRGWSHEAEDDGQAPAAAPPSTAGAEKFLGTTRRANPKTKKGNDKYNYEEKYPEDASTERLY
ncbi:hypothetical protein EDD18DRAFT_1109234 [Armillaria luteobubalina]|uniref:Uncharacterized protein n=1 Tax=Armillaria luteobubalina TaxID=153913 RepID=A0AA39PXW9_9AGAR|nr:hypothetical protein EDD18DRAFT_1109234 [Armillaria luteobubalina]